VIYRDKSRKNPGNTEQGMTMPEQPLTEVFGFPVDNHTEEATRYRKNRLCPYNNKVPNCTKDKAENPLGVCSIFDGQETTIICPVRFRQNWQIIIDAAQYFFPAGTKWTSLTEIRLSDKHGKTAGNIDIVLVAYDEAGHITDFGSIEVQGVYISGNLTRPFNYYMSDPEKYGMTMDWTGNKNYPRPDYLSSSRKRLAPQLIYKGGILKAWGKKQAVVVHKAFFSTLPHLQTVNPDKRDKSDIVWLIYDLKLDTEAHRYNLVLDKTVYTLFGPALEQITKSEAGPVDAFIGKLQEKLDSKLQSSNVPEAPTLQDVITNYTPDK
jgi:hypothetical protein